LEIRKIPSGLDRFPQAIERVRQTSSVLFGRKILLRQMRHKGIAAALHQLPQRFV